jgi:methyl-accepting chemotaxis protein
MPTAAPVLVVRGDGATHRLPAASGPSGAPEDGQPWTATFVWQTAPVPFNAAQLELGDDFVVELPQPGETDGEGYHVLELRRTGEAQEEPVLTAAPDPPPSTAPDPGVGQVHLQAELLEAQQEGRELRASLQQVQEELSRARADLTAEREGRAGDAARFRDGLAQLEASAEEALASHEAAMADLRRQLEAAGAERTQAVSEARAEGARLRERLTSLEHAAKDVDELRSQLERARSDTAGAHAELESTRGAVAEAQAEAQRLLGRLTSIADVPDTRT